MKYIEEQRKKAIRIRDEFFRDPGQGSYKNSDREFVLKNPLLNIWDGIREDVLHYFGKNEIQFWDAGKIPTGHLLSSQIACINHLYFLRQRKDAATAVLKGIDPDIKTAMELENGFVEFEVIGKKNYLGEISHRRGANSTSVDAVMLAEMNDNSRKLVFIEWKYVESYGKESKAAGESGKTRQRIYNSFLDFNNHNCLFKLCSIDGLFTEPYYQLMRQTVLAQKMVDAKEYGVSDYIHLHIIPKGNKELKDVNTAVNRLTGTTLENTWKNILKAPDKYIVVDPKDFLTPAKNCPDTLAIFTYLQKRYW
ncbi:MAG: hypothetical protein JST55_08070 [Bacteroidetes bacterium]|nr:hypothetical protein [Bacteroidota bacterium]